MVYRRLGTCFDWTIGQNLHGILFEELFITSHEYIYDLICGLYAY